MTKTAVLVVITLTFGATAKAQSFDETVAYIKDRCVDYVFRDGPLEQKVIGLEISSGGLVSVESREKWHDTQEEEYMKEDFWLAEVKVSSGYTSVSFSCHNKEGAGCVSRVHKYGGGSNSFRATRSTFTLIRCSQRSRVANAFKHLQKLLTENDSFAN